MRIKQLGQKIIIAELDPSRDYIVLVNISKIKIQNLKMALNKNGTTRDIPFVPVYGDVDKTIQFIKVPKEK